ncbi:hypothetical protein YDYSY3_56440 [Paenibacillus chitinolyticus]|nr:hypothetical protein YDYSY3_56440 [Paenibacillus chitinolyticus]
MRVGLKCVLNLVQESAANDNQQNEENQNYRRASEKSTVTCSCSYSSNVSHIDPTPLDLIDTTLQHMTMGGVAIVRLTRKGKRLNGKGRGKKRNFLKWNKMDK